MSFSMSPPAPQKPAAPPYPPQAYPNSTSPSNETPFGQPPAKRPRLSPDPRSPPDMAPASTISPHHTSSYGNPYAPKHAVQSPYNPAAYASLSPQNSFNMPQPHPSQPMPWPSYPPQQQQSLRPAHGSPPPPMSATTSQMMPPPPRPNKDDKEARIGVEEIGDSLFGSGINLKDEENYLHSTWNNRTAANESFTTQSTSFGSSTASPNNSFNMLTQATSFGSQGGEGAFAGTLGQPVSQEDVDAEVKRKREAAARSKAERDQHHMNNQFLLGNCLRDRIHRRAYENGVKLDVKGLFFKPDEPRAQVMMNGAGTEGIVAAGEKSHYIVDPGVPMEQIFSLVSLAAGERLRGLVDESYSLARARQYGDHGRVVPPEFANIAVGEGNTSSESVVPESTTRTQWDKVPGSDPMADKDTPGANDDAGTPQPMRTIAFQGTLNARLRELAERDQQAERERHRRRESRKRKLDGAATGDDMTPADTPADTPAASAGPFEAGAPVKVSKKEQSKKAKESSSQSTEAHAFNQSNQTAAMMALGKKGNRYSWMSGGVSNMPTNRFAKPAPKAEESTTAAAVTAAPATEARETRPTETTPTWGDWREDGGIQLRDWIMTLELDGRERRALQKAMNQLG